MGYWQEQSIVHSTEVVLQGIPLVHLVILQQEKSLWLKRIHSFRLVNTLLGK